MATVRIRMLTSVAGNDYSYAAGQEVEAPKEIALDLIAAGHAVLLETTNVERRPGRPSEKR